MSPGNPTVYLDGRFVPVDEARISPLDRGFLFGDGIYEVVAFYGGRPFRWTEHARRFRWGLESVAIDFDPSILEPVIFDLLERNDLGGRDSLAYLQVTRGAAPRTHGFPDPPVSPTVFASVRSWKRHPDEQARRGVEVVTRPDQRWARCDVKSLNLLPNVLAQQEAVRAGVFEALLVRDGFVLEGSHTSVHAVVDGELRAPPRSNYALPGITSAVVRELAASLDIAVRREPLALEDLERADELFLTGTSTEILPVVCIDGRPVAGGRPGPLTLRLRERYLALARGGVES